MSYIANLERNNQKLAEMLAETAMELISARKDIEFYKSLWTEEHNKNRATGELTTAGVIALRNGGGTDAT
jgi:hypothetical protein